MPQLTPDCDRVVVMGPLPSDATNWNVLHAIRLFILMMEIKISEDYCGSDIFVADFGNYTIGHITKVTPSYVKKYELCAVVSSTNLFIVNNFSRY
jgi:hypothetical protein